jgi:hypothetical protein
MDNTTPTPQALMPTPGFEFPTSIADTIDQKLRQGINPDKPRIESVRPERRKPVVPEMAVSAQTPPQAQQVVARAAVVVASGAQPFMVENPSPPVTPISTADYTSIDLPSKFAYYPFKDLYIKPFRIPHLAKLAKADDVDSMQLVCEVVSSVLMTPAGHKNIGFGLAVHDFNAIMYWLRANSFEKSTMRVASSCPNPAHHHLVAEGKLPKESLNVESVHDTSTLVTNYLQEIPDPEVYHVMVTLADGDTRRVDLKPETMLHAIEFLDDPRFIDEAFQYTARIASHLDLDTAFPVTSEKEGDPTRWTLAGKMQVVEEYLTTDQAMLILQYSELVDQFGVDEMVEAKCKECGHVEQIKLTIDARTFSAPRF